MLLDFKTARYIKLGKGGCWNDISLDRAEIHFGYGMVPHELAATRNLEAIRNHLLRLGRPAGLASDDARAVSDFYTLGSECLWITFARERLWWTVGLPEINWLGGDVNGQDKAEHGQRYRKCHPWSCLDSDGSVLLTDSLSTSLTKVAAYRKTLCRVEASEDYLRRRINCQVDPLLARAERASESLLAVLDHAIARLHPTDFETLTDLLFVRSGWLRITSLGGTRSFIDLALEQPATGERAAVQVKSRADQSVLDDYIKQYNEAGVYHRLFFVCHTPSSALVPPERGDVHIWQGRSISRLALKLGLTDWVISKVA